MLEGNPSYELEDFAGANVYCPYALADSNLCIRIKEHMAEFWSVVLPILPPYHNSGKRCENNTEK